MPVSKINSHDIGAVAAEATTVSSHQHATLSHLIAMHAEFDLLFIDPRRQLAALRAFYPDGPGTLDRSLPLHVVIAASAAIVVQSRIRDLGVVSTELMPRCGFAHVSGVLPLQQPESADISNVMALFVGQRGEVRATPYTDYMLRTVTAGLRGPQLAQALFPDLPHRLHAFAEAFTPGWTTLVANETWIEVPTL